MGAIEVESKDRPDLLIFNRPIAFTDSGFPYHSMVLIEFKRPERDDDSDRSNPIEQVYGYVEELKGGRVVDRRGRTLNVPAHTPFYTNIDLTPDPQEHRQVRRADADPGFRRRPRRRHQRRGVGRDQLFLHFPVDNNATRGRTPLARGSEGAPKDAIDRQRQVGVVHDDDGVFAAHFQRNSFVEASTVNSYRVAGLRRSSKRNERHVRVPDKRIAGFLAVAKNKINYPVGQPSVDQYLNQT